MILASLRSLPSLAVLFASLLLLGCPDDDADPLPDVDGDGFHEEEDCDDNDDLTYPGAEELCDGIDNDCDGLVPEDEHDGDGDGLSECEGDCDDEDEEINPGATEVCDGVDNDCDGTIDGADAADAEEFFADNDGDGYGDAEVTTMACSQPPNHTTDNTDCDDQSDEVHPGADEVCNTIDDDCDSFIDEEDALDAEEWYLDSDGDGYGDAKQTAMACNAPSGYVDNTDDCDDADALVNPGATEVCDGIDNDCSGQIDGADAADAATYYGDDDGDGYGDDKDVVTDCTQPKGYVTVGGDCDDTNASVHPGAEEWCNNGVDEDCSGKADETCLNHCDNITTDTTWTSAWIHVITCDTYVQGPNAPELTVEDGTIVRFEAGVDLFVAYSNYGSLRVDGHTQGVLFGSQEQNPSPGDWNGVNLGYYDSGSELIGLTLEHAGGNNNGNLWLNHASPTLTGIVSRFSSEHGLYAEGGSLPRIEDSWFSDNAEDGVYIGAGNGLDGTNSPTFSGNTMTANGGYPMTVPAHAVGEIEAASCDFTGNADDQVRVLGSTLSADATWGAINVPYFIEDDVYVQSPSTPLLTIEDGATLAFDHGADLFVAYSNYGELAVEGTNLGVVMTAADPNPQPGDWNGLYLGYYDVGSTLTGLTVEYGGGNNNGGVWLEHASPDLEACTVRLSSEHGLYAAGGSYPRIQNSAFVDNTQDGLYFAGGNGLDDTGSPTFVGNTGSGNGEYAMTLPASSVGEIDGSCVFASNGDDFIRVLADTVAEDATWQAQQVPFFIDDDVYVQSASSPLLVIEDGVICAFDHNTDLYVAYSNYGELEVQGNTVGVTFTAADPSPQPGDWNGLYLGYYDAGSSLTGLTVEYGGGNNNGGIWVNHADVDLDGVTVTDSSEHGLYADGGSTVEIVNSAFQDNTEDGVHISLGNELDHVGSPTFVGNGLSGNGGFAMSVPSSSAGEIDATCTFSGNTSEQIRVLGDTVIEDATWQAQQVPYYIDDDVYVQAAGEPHLTIEAGAELQFGPGSDLLVAYTNYGSLEAQGTGQDPVIFTSAQGTPAHGDWSGIYLGYYCVGNQTHLSNVVVEYGGDNGQGNVVFNHCDGSISSSTVQYSSNYGIYVESSNPTISNVTYVDNLSGDTN